MSSSPSKMVRGRGCGWSLPSPPKAAWHRAAQRQFRCTFLLVLFALHTWAGTPDGGMGEVVDVEMAAILTPQGLEVTTGPGCFLDEKRCVVVAKELVDARTTAQELEKHGFVSPAVFIIGVAVALAGGIALGFTFAKLPLR